MVEGWFYTFSVQVVLHAQFYLLPTAQFCRYCMFRLKPNSHLQGATLIYSVFTHDGYTAYLTWYLHSTEIRDTNPA